jgi:hypothetical protein
MADEQKNGHTGEATANGEANGHTVTIWSDYI